MYFRYCGIISPWKRSGLFWEQTSIPFTKGCFVQSWVEIGPVVLEKKIFLNFVNLISLFHNYLHLKKGGALHINKLEFPLPKDALCQVWLKLAQWFWRRRRKCVCQVFDNNYNNNDNDDYNNGQGTDVDQKSSLEPSVQVS